MKKKMYVAAILTGFMLPVASQAEQPVATMEEVVVTATRTPSTLDKVGGSSVTVITAEDIEAKQQVTVEEVLKGVPGVDVVANGGHGTRSSVFIRGADSKNTLILVDGVMFNDPSSANRAANLANLTTDNIERIEIVRGPMSVLYGSNATAGVINIITKKGVGPTSLYVGTEGGSYGTWKGYGGVSGASEKFNYSMNLSRSVTEGFSIANDDNDSIPHAGNTSEDDGWQNTTLSGKFGLDVNSDFDITANVRVLDSEVDGDDYSWSGYAGDRFNGATPEPTGTKENRTESEQYLGKIDIHNFFYDKFLESNLYYQASRHDRTSFDNDGAESYDYSGKSQEVGWQGSLNFSDMNQVTMGTGYFQEKMESKSAGITKKDAETVSLWGQEHLFLGDNLELVAGMRYDDHDRFGDKITFRVAPAYTIDKTDTSLKASYGTGFRAPSLYELFSSYGNEALGAEESEGWDLGFEQELANGSATLGVTYFDVTFENRIAYDFAISKYNQLAGDTKTKGLETFVQWMPVSNLNFLLSYTYTDTEGPDGDRLTRRPLNKVYLNSKYRITEKLQLNMDFYWVDERDAISSAADKDGNSVNTLAAYTLVNIAANYDISDNLQIYGRIDNLFDEEYEEAWSYASPGLSGYVGLKFTY